VEGPDHRYRLQLSPQKVLFLSDVSAGLDADRPAGSVMGLVMHARNALLATVNLREFRQFPCPFLVEAFTYRMNCKIALQRERFTNGAAILKLPWGSDPSSHWKLHANLTAISRKPRRRP